MTITSTKPGSAFAEQLIKQSETTGAVTAMDAVVDAARAGTFTRDHCFRSLARLWTLKRMLYYVYGGWAQGINLNEYPPEVAYLFGKQNYDEVFESECTGCADCLSYCPEPGALLQY